VTPSPTARAEQDDWDAHWAKYSKRARVNPGQLMRFGWLVRRVSQTIAAQTDPILLDIGSGTGHLLQIIHERLPALEAIGVEYSQEGVEIGRRAVPSATFVQADLLQPQSQSLIGDRLATVATCSEVLEHVDDPSLLMRTASAFLGSGAIVHVTVPGGPMSAFDHAIGHRQHFTPESLSRVMEAAGYETVSAGRIGFPFFNLYRYLIIASADRVESAANSEPSAAELTASHVFSWLMHLNVGAIQKGFQIVGSFRRP
ncbi:MAG: class I SAM-dependent methyltransferase, partial [Gammaproteobacteria bacterium]|nr:class I SAM-dependent methyltransferase [Gammaproteobacteria bacterium]